MVQDHGDASGQSERHWRLHQIKAGGKARERQVTLCQMIAAIAVMTAMAIMK